jgi:predicted AlkP superfamily phosphohydrolase/phosphomutase
LKGREFSGIVDPADRDALLDEIAEKLLAVRDPDNGKPVIAKVYRSDEVYHGPHTAEAPDLIVGYHRNYRSSWLGSQGDMDEPVVSSNNAAWSADHCMAAEEVPGVILSNRRIFHSAPSLIDVAPTILTQFKLDIPRAMTGGDIFQATSTAAANLRS